MLQRLLGEFLEVDGVDQATAIDDRGRLLSSVGAEGQLPSTQRAVDLTVAALDIAQGSQLGELHEVWVEGEATTCIDIVTLSHLDALWNQRKHRSLASQRRPIASTTGHNP